MTTLTPPSKCTFCGAPLPADAKFCGACGQTVSMAAAPTPANILTPPPTPPVNAAPTIPPPSPLNITAPCPHCGQSISVDYERCPFCGGATKLETSAPVPPAAPRPVAPAPAYIPPPRPAVPAPGAPTEKKKFSTGCIVGIVIAILLLCLGLCVVAVYFAYSEGLIGLLPWLAQLL